MQVDQVGQIWFCHATPRNENEIFTSQTSEDARRLRNEERERQILHKNKDVLERELRALVAEQAQP